MTMVILDRLFSLIFPPRCACCRQYLSIPAKGLLCSNCQSLITPLNGPECSCCGRPFVSQSGMDHLCSACSLKKPPFSRACSMFLYEKTIRELIHRYKYHGDTYAMRALVVLSRKQLIECRRKLGCDLDVWVLPVPLHKKRLRKRGFNQSLVLARKIFKREKVRPDMLFKTRSTPSQTGLSLKERKRNVSGVFSCHEVKPGKDVIIFDDVFTTGATAAAAARVVKEAGARRVFVLTLARTPEV